MAFIVTCATCHTPIRDIPLYRVKKTRRFWCSEQCKSDGMRTPASWSPDVATAAYIAGILDGEGSIFIAERKQKGSQYRYAFLVATVINTDHRLIAFIMAAVGAGVPFREFVQDGKLGRRPVYHLWFTHHRAVAFLTALLPHLLLKRDKAVLGIEFQGLPLSERRLDARGQEYRKRVNENQRDPGHAISS